MVDFSKLKARRGSKNTSLMEKMEKLAGASGFPQDERIYKPSSSFDKKEGKGYVVLRFLPAKEGDAIVKQIAHNFQAKNGWYNEISRASIGEEDPVGVSNRLYWNKGEDEGNDSLKNIARQRKRNTVFFANVYIIKDQFNPENEGQVKIMQFGKQIFDKISEAIKPEFEDVTPIDPFDLWEGKDFIIRMVGRSMPNSKGETITVPNYESSRFADVTSTLFGDEPDDAKKKEVFEKTHSLMEFIECKSFDELAGIFLQRTGEAYNALEFGDAGAPQAKNVLEEMKEQAEMSKTAEPVSNKTAEAESLDSYSEETKGSEEYGEYDVLAQFKKLANS